ncbi:helix-turn-helix domain-containing protein [Agathobaculum sp. NTUH-O15-33]|uniref:helix-turn-helix transcriptional regulator n=1 Tax=Agathobaculum sp. NTUH-O15-33 TaxID=3079302 RepID=UPI0029588DC8|nr:helix-turn-helix domain-containing protein [Agathobaculum sp. NTUH-O15-33]WNX85759.1 helix-turn-helix domain-containing protein [Agathobaculum sp. NTUH-O15-33]
MENQVRYYRIMRRLTQDELSARAGVSKATISQIETGKRIPGVDIALMLEAALHADVHDLFRL